MSVMDIAGQRVLCLGEVRGRLSTLNDLATAHRATAIVCTGTFGFFDAESPASMSPSVLRHAVQFSPMATESLPAERAAQVEKISDGLSELPAFLSKRAELSVPVYCVPGSGDDVRVVNKFSNGEYSIPNLYILNDTSSFFLETPGQKARIHLFGLGGALRVDRLFDVGSSSSTAPGVPGEMWIGAWQMGRLVAHLHDVWRLEDVHIFVSHASPVSQPLLQSFAAQVRADVTISSGLHYRNIVSVVPASVEQSLDSWLAKLATARSHVQDQWAKVRVSLAKAPDSAAQLAALEPIVNFIVEQPTALTLRFLRTAYHNQWHWNLCDTENGALVLAFNGDRLASETVSAGFCYGKRQAFVLSKKREKPPRTERAERQAAKSGNGAFGAPVVPSSSPASATGSTGTAPAESSDKRGDSRDNRDNRDNEHTGLWFRDGQRPEQEILDCLHSEDRANVKEIVFKDPAGHPGQRSDGSRPKYCIVYFGSPEQAAMAYERVDKDKAGSVAITTAQPQRSRRKA